MLRTTSPSQRMKRFYEQVALFRQTGWFIAGLMTGLPATARPQKHRQWPVWRSPSPPRPRGCDSHVTGHAVLSAGVRGAERLDCYDRLPAPLSPSGFDGRWSKPVLWARPGPAPQSRKKPRGQHHRTAGDAGAGGAPDVVITTPAIGHVPPRPVLMFSAWTISPGCRWR